MLTKSSTKLPSIQSPYYAQCYPGVATPTSTTSTWSRTSAATTTTTPNTLSTITTTQSSTSPNTDFPAGSVPTTLVNGYYWIRAVSPPNYHLYLQSSSPLSAGTALINTHTSAGQFQLTADGQLVYYRGTSATPLYLNIENPTNKTQRKLQTQFQDTKNSYGKFAFQGDTLTWSVADISRPNTAAWLVCAGQELFVNTGAYGYDTPAGCADQTVSLISFLFFESPSLSFGPFGSFCGTRA